MLSTKPDEGLHLERLCSKVRSGRDAFLLHASVFSVPDSNRKFPLRVMSQPGRSFRCQGFGIN